MGQKPYISFVGRIVLGAIAGFMLVSCATDLTNPAVGWITSDPQSNSWTPLANDRQIDLPAGAVQNAIAELGDKSAVPLDNETFERLVRYRAWPSDSDHIPYLIRGVALEEPLGSIHVLQNGTELLVVYNGPIVRARQYGLPIVVLLPAAPTRVFVSIRLYG
jgi:hypothetical protein